MTMGVPTSSASQQPRYTTITQTQAATAMPSVTFSSVGPGPGLAPAPYAGAAAQVPSSAASASAAAAAAAAPFRTMTVPPAAGAGVGSFSSLPSQPQVVTGPPGQQIGGSFPGGAGRPPVPTLSGPCFGPSGGPPPGSQPLGAPPLPPPTSSQPIYQDAMPQEEEAPEIPVWYPAASNWHQCIDRMAMDFRAVTNQFSGEWSEQERLADETKLEQAQDFLHDKTGGRLGKEYSPKMRTAKVIDIFQDIEFPPSNSSWYIRSNPRDFHELAPPDMWKRLQEFSLDTPYPVMDAQAGSFNPHGGRVYQGALEDFYLVAGLQTIGMKSKLISDIFANMEFSNPRLGYFTLRLYKHGQWHSVQIDDALPFDKEYKPLCCSGEFWPDLAWPSLIEKAYAKLHGSWEGLGGGGHVEEVLTDLTGGCSSRFGTSDVAPDRLWQYLFELMPWCVFGCNINEAEFSKRNIPIEQHWAASIWNLERHEGVPYICVCIAAPSGTLRHMPICDVPSADGYGWSDGFVWLRIDDFVSLFDTIYECRLVNTDLGPLMVSDVPCSPGWVSGYPWFEELWAFQNSVVTETAPSFLFEVRDTPCVITVEVSQSDVRFTETDKDRGGSRGMQAPLLLRFYQCSREVTDQGGGEIYLAHLSAWGHCRDACCGVKVLRPGKFLAMVSLPARYTCDRMIFRSYSTKPLAMKPIVNHRSWIAVNPSRPLDVMPYSLAGFQRVDALSEKLPQMFDEAEGRGKPMANGQGGNLTGIHSKRMHVKSALEKRLGSSELDPHSGLKVVGKFGGRDAVATIEAAEVQDGCVIG